MREKQFKILAVDDNPKNIQVIGSILRKANYQVGFAFNGQQALDLLGGSNDYDLVLLDVNMPVMNGYETCIQIRKNPSLENIPVIFLTALSEVENIVRGFDSGAQDYVSKPFNSMELLARVQTHVELKDSREKLLQVNVWLEQKVNERTIELQQSNRALDSANKQLKNANKELLLLDEAKADFLRIISHEINTPLNGIIGFTNILKEELKNVALYEMLDFLDLSAKRLEKFANISLLITELKTKRKKIYWEDIELETLFDELTGSMKKQLEQKEIKLVFNIQGQSILGDKKLVKRSFESLLENAIKYSPPKGVISILVREDDDFIVCEVLDEGIGFLAKILEEPFKMFAYGKEHVDEDKGLSLTLVELIMEAHKGKIEIDNRKEGGAIVSLSFRKKTV